MKKTRCRQVLLTVMLLLTMSWMSDLQAQDDNPQHSVGSSSTPRHAIDTAMAISPAYMPVNVAPFPGTFFTPMIYTAVDTSMFHKTNYDPLCSTDHLYQELGIYAQAHQPMAFDYQHDIGFSMIRLPYPLYFKRLKDLKYYDVQTSYTDLAYTIGFTPENNFWATHTQKIKQFNYVFHLNGYSNSGKFLRQNTQMLDMDLILHYETPKDIYGVTAAYIINHIKCYENGGLSDWTRFTDRNFWEELGDTRKSPAQPGTFNVNLSHATTLINTHDAFLQQYVNFKDKKEHYFGTLSHTLEFGKVKSTFTDFDLNDDYYRNQYYINTDTTNDTLHYYNIVNTVQWSNFKPLSKASENNYSFRVAVGFRHEYVHAFMPYYQGNNFTGFARTNIRLFKVWDLYGSFAYSLNNYNKNDAIANIGATFTISKKMQHFLGGSVDFYRVSPDYFYTYYIGNNNLWYNDFRKENNLKVNAFWTLYGYKIGFNYFMMNHHVYLNSNYEPVVSEKAVNVVQFNVFAPIRIHHFSMDANLFLQHSTRSCVNVPLFAGKLHAAYDFRIFKNRLRIMVGGDLMYNTAYYADGYNPILHQFYVQNDVEVGNFLYFDASLTLQVQRISFFVKGGNLLSGILNYNYFTTPYYPMQGRSVRIGICWRFYD